MKTTKVLYLACPYYHSDYRVMAKRVKLVTKICGELLLKGIYCFSPVTQNHQIRKECDIESGWKIWKEYDSALLSHCDGLLVLTLDGWKESKGIKGEIKEAQKLDIPIWHLSEEEALSIRKSDLQLTVCRCGHGETHHIPHCSHSFCQCLKFRGVL